MVGPVYYSRRNRKGHSVISLKEISRPGWFSGGVVQAIFRHTGLVENLVLILFKKGALLSSMLDTYVVLIPKSGKDLTCCSSYRPIALLNADLKVLTKVLATRVSIVLPSLVDVDQTGFMAGKSTDTNLLHLFTHLQISHNTTGTRAVV